MIVFYSPIEVIEMAIKTEETGKEFYTNAAKKIKSKPLAELFNFLANEETKHARTYRSLYKIIIQTPQSIPFNWEEFSLYLKAITDSKFFLGSDKSLSFITKSKTSKSLLDYAISFEKETMLFYLEILNFINKKDKPIVDKIIAQEKEHIKKLSSIKEKI